MQNPSKSIFGLANFNSESIKKFLEETDAGKRLTKKEERILLIAAQDGCEVAVHRLVQSCYRVITKEATNAVDKHRFGRANAEDLFFSCFHAAVERLFEAIRRFDTKYDVYFITYAMSWIKLGIRKEIEADAKQMRPINNIADKTEAGFVPVEDAEDVIDSNNYEPNTEMKSRLRAALNNGALDYTEKYVLKSRYGIGGHEHTTDEIASVLHKSPKAITEIENSALRKLYKKLT